MKILFCPTHYTFDDGNTGSEISWAFQIVNRTLKKFPSSVAVTGFRNTQKKYPYKIVQLQKKKRNLDMGIVNTIKFNYLYTRYLFSTLHKEEFDIHHHVLPFAIGRTFNIPMIMRNSAIKAKIIGPIQNSLPSFDDDFNIASITNSSISNNLSSYIFKGLYPILNYLSMRTLHSADKLIVINKMTRDLLIKKGIDKSRIVILPPGIDCKVYEESRNRGKRKYIEIIAVGNLIKRKGFDMVIRGVSDLYKHNDKIKLRIIGEGPQRKNLEKLVHTLFLEDVVIFEGKVPYHEIKNYYKNADIFVSMSRAEGFATVCLEAMASGLAIISSKVGGFSDAIKEGVNGYLVNVDDYHTLGERLNELCNDQIKLKALGESARKSAEGDYDWDSVIIPKYLEIYQSLIK